MKTVINKRVVSVLLTLVLILGSCKKDFLDINDNPNSPTDVDMKFILPSAQAALAYTLGNQLHVFGGLWSQYWTQGPNANQYNDYDRYTMSTTDADRPWLYLYAGTMKDLDALYKKAKSEGNSNYAGIALILRAYTMQVITDAWGDAPFTEALQGFEGNVTPKYDSQESIYDALPAILDSAIALLNDGSGDVPGSDDLVYQGDMFSWYKFANTLKLKIYLRQSGVRQSVASAGIAAMSADPTEYLESGEDAVVHYIDEKFRQNPLWTTTNALGSAKNIFASNTSIDYLNSLNDPRIADFYDENGSGQYVGLTQGEGRTLPSPQDDTKFSMYNHSQIIAPEVPVRLMTAAESMFLQAEASARGFMTGDAKGLYEGGIEESWNQWENSSSTLDSLPDYLLKSQVAFPGSQQDQIKAIITQKWIAMNGNQNFEAWTEWRRTGYPDFLIQSVTSVLAPGVFPARLLYSSDEITTNPNSPKGVTLSDHVWWDVN